MRTYKPLTKQVFTDGDYSIVPIRNEDREAIRVWRNEQMYHLRQAKELNVSDQDLYFDTVVHKLFQQDHPAQLLFSYLHHDTCIGYGGLVHINWVDQYAEISFIMNTQLEKSGFQEHWQRYLGLIEEVAFSVLNLHKIFTYAFDLRPHLYAAMEGVGYLREATLKEHCFFEGTFKDVVIHTKWNRPLTLRNMEQSDEQTTLNWATDERVRRYALNQKPISSDEHKQWFKTQLDSPDIAYYMAEYRGQQVGTFRLNHTDNKDALISYLLDPKFHGKGLGKLLLEAGISVARTSNAANRLLGQVKPANTASIRIFENLGFTVAEQSDQLITYQLTLA